MEGVRVSWGKLGESRKGSRTIGCTSLCRIITAWLKWWCSIVAEVPYSRERAEPVLNGWWGEGGVDEWERNGGIGEGLERRERKGEGGEKRDRKGSGKGERWEKEKREREGLERGRDGEKEKRERDGDGGREMEKGEGWRMINSQRETGEKG